MMAGLTGIIKMPSLRWKEPALLRGPPQKKVNKGYKVKQIAGKVDYFVSYVDRSSLILVGISQPSTASAGLEVTPFSCFGAETLPGNGMQIEYKG